MSTPDGDANRLRIRQILQEHWSTHYCSPSLRDLAKVVDLAPTTVLTHLRRMEAAGHVVGLGSRGWRLSSRCATCKLPICPLCGNHTPEADHAHPR